MTSFDTTPLPTAAFGGTDTPLHRAVARLVDLAGTATGAPIAYVWLPDDAPAPGCSAPRPGPRLRAYAHEVVATGRPVVVHDGYAAAEGAAPRAERALAFLGAPILRDEGDALGALCLVDRRPRMWTTEEVATVGTLARAIAAELQLGE